MSENDVLAREAHWKRILLSRTHGLNANCDLAPQPHHTGTTMPRTLCIGVDVTWWGGSSSNRISRRETIVAISIGEGPGVCQHSCRIY